MLQKKKIKQYVEESGEQLKKRTVETAKQTFTALSKDVISQITGSEREPEAKNFTPFNDEIRKKMGENFANQESDELSKVREQLSQHDEPDEALKEQLKQQRFNQFKQEEKRAQDEMKAEEDARKKKQAEEDEQRRQEEARRQQAMSPVNEPQGKEARGGLFARKKKRRSMPTPTVENQAAQGKQ